MVRRDRAVKLESQAVGELSEGVLIALLVRAVASPDIVRLYELMTRVDELCREALAIREELAKTATERAPWPTPRGVARVVTKLTLPADFLPTSTTESGRR